MNEYLLSMIRRENRWNGLKPRLRNVLMAADLFLSIKKIQMNNSTEVDTFIALVYNLFFPKRNRRYCQFYFPDCLPYSYNTSWVEIWVRGATGHWNSEIQKLTNFFFDCIDANWLWPCALIHFISRVLKSLFPFHFLKKYIFHVLKFMSGKVHDLLDQMLKDGSVRNEQKFSSKIATLKVFTWQFSNISTVRSQI